MMGFARECWPFVLPPAILAVLSAALGHFGWAVTLALVALLILLFFRVPQRRPSGDTVDVLSPADGKILRIDRLEDPAIGPGKYHRIVIFLSVFNVHVQRAPVAGKIVESRYAAGRKVAAFRAEAGDVNEQQLTVLERCNGDRIGIRQIAGLLARRVVTYLRPGQDVARGELIGLIKFGSRVDLLVPVSYPLLACVGQRVREGQTTLAQVAEVRNP